MIHELQNNDVHNTYFFILYFNRKKSQTYCALIEIYKCRENRDRQIPFFFITIKMFNHNRKWGTSSSSYYLELVYIYSIDHLYRIKKSCHCYNVLIRKATNIGSSLSWDSTLRYKCEQSSHLSFSPSLSLFRSLSRCFPQRLVPIQFVSPE